MMKIFLWITFLLVFLTGCQIFHSETLTVSDEKKVLAGGERKRQGEPIDSKNLIRGQQSGDTYLQANKVPMRAPASKSTRFRKKKNLDEDKLQIKKDWYIAHIPTRIKEQMGLDVIQNKALQDEVLELRGKLNSNSPPRRKFYIPNVDFGAYHALVIGNNDYENLKKLNTAINDADVISDLLQNKYGFRAKLISNGSRRQIINALNDFKETLKRSDNFLIYYAGHGTYDKDMNSGFWQPINAKRTNIVDWIPNDDVTRIIKGIKANNVMVVADSCYSGTLVRGSSEPKLSAENQSQFLKRMIEKKTRVALTSGGNEPVADAVAGGKHSTFAKVFIKILRENNSVLTAAALSEDLKKEVIPIMESYQITQTPEYSSMHKAGHDGGDFVFVPQQLIGN